MALVEVGIAGNPGRLAIQLGLGVGGGASDLRAHGTERAPAKLWQTNVQLPEAEAAFRTLKSEVKVRPN